MPPGAARSSEGPGPSGPSPSVVRHGHRNPGLQPACKGGSTRACGSSSGGSPTHARTPSPSPCGSSAGCSWRPRICSSSRHPARPQSVDLGMPHRVERDVPGRVPDGERRRRLAPTVRGDRVVRVQGELAPVLEIDGRTIGDGAVGSLTRRIQELFSERTATGGTPLPSRVSSARSRGARWGRRRRGRRTGRRAG